MTRRMSKTVLSVLSMLVLAAPARADLITIAKCQKAFAREGAKFALKVLRSNLRCTDGISECQIECELGQFGPSCDNSPPPCCDSDDTGSNAEFANCMNSAHADCDVESSKRAIYEFSRSEERRVGKECITWSRAFD